MSGLLSTVRAAFDTGWDALGDLRQTITVRRVSRGQYNPATGNTNDTVLSATPLAVLISFEADLVDGTDIRIGDLRCIIRGKDIAFTPEQGDTVDLPDGTRWTVHRRSGDLYTPPLHHDLALRR